METDQAFRLFQNAGDVFQRDSRGVGGQNRFRTYPLLQIDKQGLLGFEIFKYRFDDDVGPRRL